MSDLTTIFLNYDFNQERKDIYQGVYYSHFHGTTLAIGAKLIPEYDCGLITRMKADFISMVMGGTINFAIDSVNSIATLDENKYQNIEIRLNMFTDRDMDFDKTVIEFEKPYDPKKHVLRITIGNKQIVNLKKEMINICTTEIDDYRSCDILTIPDEDEDDNP